MLGAIRTSCFVRAVNNYYLNASYTNTPVLLRSRKSERDDGATPNAHTAPRNTTLPTHPSTHTHLPLPAPATIRTHREVRAGSRKINASFRALSMGTDRCDLYANEQRTHPTSHRYVAFRLCSLQGPRIPSARERSSSGIMSHTHVIFIHARAPMVRP